MCIRDRSISSIVIAPAAPGKTFIALAPVPSLTSIPAAPVE